MFEIHRKSRARPATISSFSLLLFPTCRVDYILVTYEEPRGLKTGMSAVRGLLDLIIVLLLQNDGK